MQTQMCLNIKKHRVCGCTQEGQTIQSKKRGMVNEASWTSLTEAEIQRKVGRAEHMFEYVCMCSGGRYTF